MKKKVWKMMSLLMSSVMLFTSVNTMAVAGEIQDATEMVVEESEAMDYGLSNPVVEGDVTTWDCVYFGNYNDSAIKWRVLNVDGDDAFLLADTGLIEKAYNDTYKYVTWETCTLRSWLNGYSDSANVCNKDYTSDNFINSAFNDSEKSAIYTTELVNDNNPDDDTEGGNDTSDKVFLLSIGEVEETSYGFISNTSRTNESYWWLRSPGEYRDDASYVYNHGLVKRSGGSVNNKSFAVRPALHLKLSSSTVWCYAGTVASDGTVKIPSYTISFNAMDGALSSEEVHRTVCIATELGELPVAEHNTKCFVGWYTEENAGDKVEATTSFITDKDITLYAHWTEHTRVIDIAAKEPSCTEAGATEGAHCSVCGKTLSISKTVSSNGHVAVNDAAVDSTCGKTGLTEGSHCSVCKAVLVKQEIVPMKTEHSWDEGVVTKEPNLKFDGVKTYSCKVCQKTKEEVIPKIEDPEKKVVDTKTETKEDGTKVTTETHKDGTITEKTEIELPDGMKDTSVQKIEIVADKDDKDTSDKEAKYSVSIEQTGNATITQDVLDLVKNQIADKKDVKAKKVVVDLTVVTKDEQGNEYSVTASSKDLKKNAKLTVYAIDPVTGELILVDASSKACKFDKKTGLSLPELSGTNDYKLLSSSQASKALKDILKTVQLKNAKLDSAVGGTVKVELLTKADDEKGLNLNNLEKMEILKSKKYTVNEETNEITLADNVKKGTVSVKVKVTLKNGKTKTLTMKVKVNK